jgi:ABC-type uncharacterized transport system ATPase subunit
MMQQDYLLETSKLRKQIGNFLLMEGLDFKLHKGEIRGLIGPNGAGKSSLMHLITGKTEPTSGEIYYSGDNITHMALHERVNRGIGIKFQISNVFLEDTIANNIQLSVQKKNHIWNSIRKKEANERTEEILQMIGLQDKREWLAKELSHGEKQWLEIGMVIGISPKLLMLDEPTSGMTRYETEKTAELIYDIQRNYDTTILIVEHDFPFIKEICDRITVLHYGDILAEGTVQEIAENEEVQNVYLGRKS